MEALDNDAAKAALWVESFEQCVADDNQWDDRDKDVHGDHEGEVLALDPIEPANGFDRKGYPPTPLNLLLISPRPRDPLRESSATTVAVLLHSPPLARSRSRDAITSRHRRTLPSGRPRTRSAPSISIRRRPTRLRCSPPRRNARPGNGRARAAVPGRESAGSERMAW
jgi:hypothetical protein